MNCLEFRRSFLEDPVRDGEALREHRRGCERCRHWHAEAVQSEGRLRRALKLPVPEDLVSSILLAQTTAERGQRKSVSRHRRLWAIAAALVLAVGAAGTLVWNRLGAPLTELAAGHMSHEPEALALREPIAADAVGARLRDLGADIAGIPGQITYVARCPIGLHRGLHMVSLEDSGPVTVLYLPGARAEGDPDFRHGPWHGRQHAVPKGLLIVIAAQPDGLESVESRWVTALGGVASAVASHDSDTI